MKSSDSLQNELNLLEKLDRQPTSQFYWSLTLLATIGGFLFGYDTANIGSALNFLPYHLSPLAVGYLVAGASLGAAVGAILAGRVTDRMGRKSLLVFDAGLYAVGALLSAFAFNLAILLIARTLIGLAIGADSAIATAYIAEYAPKDKRGKLGILQQWMITVGILMAYVVAVIVLTLWPQLAGSIDWRLLLGLGAVPAIIGFLMRVRMPESPRWLIDHGQFNKLKKILQMLGIEVSDADILTLAQNNNKISSKSSPRTKNSGVTKALVIASVFMIFQQITGINIPMYYGPKILKSFFASGSQNLVTSSIHSVEATAILALVFVLAQYLAFRHIDQYGRKRLAALGYGGMALFMLIAGIGLMTLQGLGRGIVILVAFSGFITFFAWGVGGTGWLIQGEYFPTEVRGRMAATVATVDWLANFVLIEVFPLWQKGVGLAWVMISFAVLSLLAVWFVARFVPETKGLSVEEIAQVFNRT
ncbi:MAG: sugar porter family MFS transporter [Firmicutes bacterium]|jgi:sugar porter (SP) family MFS transporter|nr:sugar porter family MFS transporter [Bacillota bacterium]